MKRILYFFPLNPVDGATGSCTRVLSLLKYFKLRGIQVDFLSKKDWGRWAPDSIKEWKIPAWQIMYGS